MDNLCKKFWKTYVVDCITYAYYICVLQTVAFYLISMISQKWPYQTGKIIIETHFDFLQI